MTCTASTGIALREHRVFEDLMDAQRRRTSRIFVWLMLAQWVGAAVAAVVISPTTWIGERQRVHEHVLLAVVMGGALALLPIVMALRDPTSARTRHVVAVSQMLFSGLLIHLTGGRIETHFHVLGSLAFLAFYRDVRVLLTATLVVGLDHLLRGLYLPLSVFGAADVSRWRWLEHVAWVAFEDVVLVAWCVQGVRELRRIAHDRVRLERQNEEIEQQVRERTASLEHTTEALRDSERRTREALRDVHAANIAKSEFLANMSHEIRTPMTAILGYADLLTEPHQSAEQRADSVHTIRRNGEHLLAIINDILDLSRIESGRMCVEAIPCSPMRLCEEVGSLMQVRAQTKGVRLEVRCDERIPAILSDPLRLRQVLVNLVGNGIKFTERGSVRLTATIDDDPEGIEPEGRVTVRFRVEDTGIGIDADQLDLLFRPFTQADCSTTRLYGGSGLGLHISHRLVYIMGGELHASSEPGVGSVFSVVLPTPVAPPGALPEDVHLHRNALPPPIETAYEGRVLLVEDGPDNQRLIAHHLGRLGLEVEVASNGRAGVDAALASRDEGRPFDLVFMDMQMPVLDGYSAASLLRERGWRSPIVALTAHAMRGDRDRCLNAGCDDYITKPINRADLAHMCGRWLLGGAKPSAA